MLSLTDRLNLSVELLRSIDVRREATSNRGIGSAVERDILDRELAELTFQWNQILSRPESQTYHEYADIPPGRSSGVDLS